MSQRKPTALDLILSAMTERNLSRLEGIEPTAARRELQVKTELCEADLRAGCGADYVKAKEAYRQWRTEQEQQT